MSVTVRPYRTGGWEVDIRVTLPDNSEHRQRKKCSLSSKSAARRWALARERLWYEKLTAPKPAVDPQDVPTLAAFAPRFIEGHARANRQKAGGIAHKETVLRVHLLPRLGRKRLDAITTEDVQRLKHDLRNKAVKTVNNVLTVLNTLLKKAIEWRVIERMPSTVRLLKVPERSMDFYDTEEYEQMVTAAAAIGPNAHLAVLLGGDAGLRGGEMRALEWTDVNLKKTSPQLRVERNDWRGQVSSTKGNRVRWIPLTPRLAAALKQFRHMRSRRVLCRPDGRPLREHHLTDLLAKVARRANVRNNGPHILRHTFCSRLALKGATARSIQELAGHRDLTTTQRYMHLSPSALDDAIKLLGGPRDFGDMLETADRENVSR
jgi:integrase